MSLRGRGRSSGLSTTKKLKSWGAFLFFVLNSIFSPLSHSSPKLEDSLKCSLIKDMLSDKAFDYESMIDTNDVVTNSKYIQENTAVFYFSANPDDNESEVFPFKDTDGPQYTFNYSVKEHSLTNRCVLSIWSQKDYSDLEKFEVIFYMNDGETLWLGDKNKNMSEAFFTLTAQETK